MGLEQNFLRSFDFMKRTAPVSEDDLEEKTIVQEWTLPQNYIVEGRRQEFKYFKQLAAAERSVAFEAGVCADNDAGLADLMAMPVKSCIDAKEAFCKQANTEYGDW